MSNLLKVAMIELIRSLHCQGLSQRQIASELGINRETVARYLRQAADASKPAIAPPGSDADGDASKPAIAPPGSDADGDASKPAIAPLGSAPPEQASHSACRRGRRSDCEPWRDVISAKYDRGLSAQRIYQDLVTEHNFTGNYYSVRRFVRCLGPVNQLPFRRLECEPGEEAQVDFGTGARIVEPNAKRRNTHLFRIVLSHSRKAYSEVVYRQTTDEFIRCLENAFRYFGGAPKRLIIDNLRAAVTKADWFDPELNPKVRSFGEHYGAVFLPTRPYTPRHKGKVERSIGYAQSNALKGRVFSSLEEQNCFLLEWERTVADKRIHGTTRRQVGRHFVDAERQALTPLPLEPFPSFHEGRRTVHPDGHVEVKRAYYAVPPEYRAREVWVRWDARLVRIFNHRMERIATHVRKEPGRFSTPPEYIAAEKVSGAERGAASLLRRVAIRLGPKSAAWAEAMVQARGIEGTRVLLGLLSLANRHSTSAVEQACEIALSYVAFHLRSIRALVKRHGPQQEVMPFLSDHPVIRPLEEYGQFVHDAFQFRNTHQ
jgi:transposase